MKFHKMSGYGTVWHTRGRGGGGRAEAAAAHTNGGARQRRSGGGGAHKGGQWRRRHTRSGWGGGRGRAAARRLCLVERGDAREHLALQQLQARTAAGGQGHQVNNAHHVKRCHLKIKHNK